MTFDQPLCVETKDGVYMKPSVVIRNILSAALVAGLGLWPGEAQASRSQLDTRLRQLVDAGSTATQRVIIRAKAGKRSALKTRLGKKKEPVRREYTNTNAVVADVPVSDLLSLSDDTTVASISIDAPLKAHAEPGTSAGLPYSLRAALGILNTTYTGANIGVAVIDSGVNRTTEFSRVSAYYDFRADSGTTSNNGDGYGHGTHVAGLISGNGAKSVDGIYEGLAPGVRLIDLRVLDANGAGQASYAISALEYAVANKAALGIDIINMSLGHPIYESAATDPLVQAVEAAVRAGIVVVVSAGNVGVNPTTGLPGYGGITSPGNAPSAITVGATRTYGTNSRLDDTVAEYSSRGPSWYDGYAKPDLVAPGHRDVSAASSGTTLYTTHPELLVAGTNGQYVYMSLSGTSMATGVVSGAVALVIEASRTAFPDAPRLTPSAIKAMLQFSAIQLANADGLTQGAGSLNPVGALDLATSIDPSVSVNNLWLVSGVATASKIDGTLLTWGQNVLWGNSILWGDTVYYNEPAWATNIVWGDTILWGNNIVWGDTCPAFTSSLSVMTIAR
jgi:serine protease AprX